MAKRSNAATILVGDKKYQLQNDAIVDVKIKTGITHKKVRVIGLNMMNDGLRVVEPTGGVSEIPVKSIETIKDSGDSEFSGVEVTSK